MARDRLLTGTQKPGEQIVDTALRPKTLSEMVGQRAVIEKLGPLLQAYATSVAEGGA